MAEIVKQQNQLFRKRAGRDKKDDILETVSDLLHSQGTTSESEFGLAAPEAKRRSSKSQMCKVRTFKQSEPEKNKSELAQAQLKLQHAISEDKLRIEHQASQAFSRKGRADHCNF